MTAAAPPPLKSRLTDDVKIALRAGDKPRLGVLRLILAGVKQREVDSRTELSDPDIFALLDKMVKQRRESLEQYRQAGRANLADKEQFELEVIQSYLPEELSEAEIDALIDQVVQTTGAASARDMGKVMSTLKPQLQGRADMVSVSSKVKDRLAG